jgi:hypothetical protein
MPGTALRRDCYSRALLSVLHRRRQKRGPPEDCRGIPGVYELLEAIADPTHPNHAHLKEWAGDYDPTTFDALPDQIRRRSHRKTAATQRRQGAPRQEKAFRLGCLTGANRTRRGLHRMVTLRSHYVRCTSDRIRPRSHRKPPERCQCAPRQEKSLRLGCLIAANRTRRGLHRMVTLLFGVSLLAFAVRSAGTNAFRRDRRELFIPSRSAPMRERKRVPDDSPNL